MRAMTARFQLIATFAITAIAVAIAFALPLPAGAMTLTIAGKDDHAVVEGSGRQVSVVRRMPAFSTIRLEGALDAVAHPGPNPGVTIRADDNVEPLIETVVEGDTLVVRLRRDAGFHARRDPAVEIEFPALVATRQHGSGDLHVTAVTGARLASSISGSGDLQIDSLQVGSFALELAGSGDVKLAGHADEARFRVDGSGDVHAAAFPARKVEVSIAGSGDAEVNATDSIAASVAGSGDVTYSGHPHDVSRKVAGSGSIEAR